MRQATIDDLIAWLLEDVDESTITPEWLRGYSKALEDTNALEDWSSNRCFKEWLVEQYGEDEDE